MKKIISFMTAILLTLSLVSCSDTGDTIDETSQDTVTSEESQTGEIKEKGESILGREDLKDLDMATVTPKSIYGEYDLVLVNVMATWCGPCIQEMPDLGEIYEENEDPKFNMVAVVSDGISQEGIEESAIENAKLIREDTNIGFQMLIPSEDMAMNTLSKVQAVPTTFFVDKNGNQVGEPVVGALTKEMWKEEIQKRLEEERGK